MNDGRRRRAVGLSDLRPQVEPASLPRVMRILLATSFFPPQHRAGTENYTFGVASGLVKAGNEVRVLCAGRWADGRRYFNGHTDESYQGVSIRRLHLNWAKAPDPNRYLYDNPIVAKEVARYLTQIRPDVVHITSCLTLSASMIRIIKQMRIPVIITLTDFWFLCPRITLLRRNSELCSGQTTATDCLRCMLGESKSFRVVSSILPESLIDACLVRVSQRPSISRLRGMRGMALDITHRKEYLRETLGMADCVIAPSKSLENVFRQNGFCAPMRIVPYGHDLSWLQSYARRTEPNKVRFGYLGQIISIKGVHLVLQAFKTLPPESSATLSVFGDLNKEPPYSEQLRRIAANSSNIQFKGTFTREQLGEILGQLDVVVVPSVWYENSPLVIQEAFAAKIPVVATDLGGMSELVQHQVNGLLFERSNVQDLAHQLRRVMNEPGLLERLRAGIGAIKNMDDELHELGKVYREFMKTPRDQTAPCPSDRRC